MLFKAKTHSCVVTTLTTVQTNRESPLGLRTAYGVGRTITKSGNLSKMRKIVSPEYAQPAAIDMTGVWLRKFFHPKKSRQRKAEIIMNPVIMQAITEKKTLELRYHGYSRVVEPHAYGRDKEGDEILRCFQTSGGSESGERAGWKLLKVREVFSLHLTKETFASRVEYRRNDKAMAYVFSQL